MKIITEPTVTVVGVTQFIEHPRYKLPVLRWKDENRKDEPIEKNGIIQLQGTSCEQITAMAGKGCYDSYGADGRNIDDHIRGLINSRHGSVLEHANITLFIEGISRGCSHEVVRHRAGFAYSQRSTRYVNEDDCAIVLDPYYAELYSWWQGNAHEDNVAIKRFIETCEEAITQYRFAVVELVKADIQLHNDHEVNRSVTESRKWARGKARQLLPHAIETRMTMTGNLRAWRHFTEQRSSRFAEAEIRRLSNAIFLAIYPLAPIVFSDYSGTYIDGYHEYSTPNTKV